jgi:octaprenyl-diphosphate synthase
MLSRILLLTIQKKNTDLLGVIAEAVKEMSEGELLQIEKSRYLDITEEIYFEVIRKKTASLISACCETAAISVNSYEHRERMRNFGILVGMAFQIKDDVFDYAIPGKIGKPTGIDIREQKMTLPLIYTINNSDSLVRNELKSIIKNKNQSSKHIRRAVQLVIENGGIEYAYEKMKSIISEALILLDVFPESEAKKSLIGLLDYTINREK